MIADGDRGGLVVSLLQRWVGDMSGAAVTVAWGFALAVSGAGYMSVAAGAVALGGDLAASGMGYISVAAGVVA
ncbi:hypothetical protein C3L29_021630 [Pseudomonas sp. MWU12-2534b]|nr:hypothetical protein C3L29_021630 [Pseudomonas sp. MWU12-2534b]